MNLSESIRELLKGETADLVLGMSPNGKIWGAVKHMVQTSEDSRMEILHKAETPSVTGTVTRLIEGYNRAELNRKKIQAPDEKSKIIRP